MDIHVVIVKKNCFFLCSVVNGTILPVEYYISPREIHFPGNLVNTKRPSGDV